MPIVSLIVGSLIALPHVDPRNSRRVFEAYPTRALREGKSGAIHVRTWVDPTGKTYHCEVLQHFGDEVFQREGCKPLLRLPQRPAMTPAGTATYGVITTIIKYTTAGRNENEIKALQQPADLTLDAYAGAGQSPDFKIAVVVDEQGGVNHCEGLEDANGDHVELACARARQLGQLIVSAPAGSSVSYVTSLLVRMVPGTS